MCDQIHDEYKFHERRAVIKGMSAALAAAGLSTRNTVLAYNALTETPGLTEGPYWVDAKLNRSDVRYNSSDTTKSSPIAGLPMTLAVSVSQVLNSVVTPLSGAQVDIWHAGPPGLYSDISSENTAGQDFLRGYQVTNAHGNVQFVTVYPGWYSGRTPHVHVRVRTFSGATTTYNFASQFFFDESVTNDVYANVAPYNTRGTRDTTNATDGIYSGSSNNGNPSSNAGAQCLLRLYENRTRANASFNIVIDLSDSANADPTNGAEAGSGGAGGGGGGTPPSGGGGGTPPTGGGGGGGAPPSGGPPSGP